MDKKPLSSEHPMHPVSKHREEVETAKKKAEHMAREAQGKASEISHEAQARAQDIGHRITKFTKASHLHERSNLACRRNATGRLF
jgi:vacuolar-type H+-ATPase subunit H